MRKKDDALPDTLLDISRSIADTEGIHAVNIRAIAAKAGVATGTVYNYFANKEELLLALTEEYWRQTLSEMDDSIRAGPFYEQLQDIFSYLKIQIRQSAGRLMNSLAPTGDEGHKRMASMQQILQSTLAARMEQDADIRKDVWSKAFSKEEYARFIMMNMMMLLKMDAPDLSFLIQIIKRTIY